MVKCLNCDQEADYIISDGYIKKKRPKKFCSYVCRNQFTNRQKIIYINCPVCKKTFEKWNRKTKHKRKFCSHKCAGFISGFQTTGKPLKKYVYIWISKKRMRLHRYIMEQHLGRKLESREHIHHIDGNSENNNITNLLIVSNAEHGKISFLERQQFLKQ